MPNNGSYVYDPAPFNGDEMWSIYSAWASLTIARGFQNIVEPKLNFWIGHEGGNALFQAIRDCNIFLDNIDRVKDLDEIERKRWKAEVKFLKAYYHYYLLRMYGPIPLVKDNLPISAGVDEVKVKRQPVDVCFAYVVDLLDETLDDLPPVIEAEAKELGRITKVIALALKAKVLTTAASPLFNGNTEYANFKDQEGNLFFNQSFDVKKWELAAKACKEAIDVAHEVGHKLYYYSDNDPNSIIVSDRTNLKMNLRKAVTEKWNVEILWANSKNISIDNQVAGMARFDGNLVGLTTINSTLAPTLKIAEMFYTKNGVPIREDKTWDYAGRYELKKATAEDVHYIKEDYETVKLHFEREPRFYATLGFDGGIWYGQGRKLENNQWYVQSKMGQPAGPNSSNGFSITGYFAKKLVNPEGVYTPTNGFAPTRYPFPEIRLADLYLLYAEALNEKDGPSDEVFHYIDLVRERSGLKGVVESWTNYSLNSSKFNNKAGLREILHQERAVELAFEGQRYWDLKRWKKAYTELTHRVQGWNVNQEDAINYYVPKTIYSRKFETKDYFSPIKELDIITNPNLIQNPGWE